MRTCEACLEKHYALGYCRRHYDLMRRRGTLKPRYFLGSPMKRFERFTKKTSTCWYYVSGHNKKGYGHMAVNGKVRLAHRWAYETFKGPIPVGYELHHVCGQPMCVNPEHLVACTPPEHRLLDREARYGNAS